MWPMFWYFPQRWHCREKPSALPQSGDPSETLAPSPMPVCLQILTALAILHDAERHIDPGTELGLHWKVIEATGAVYHVQYYPRLSSAPQ